MEATGILQIDEMLYGEVHSTIGNMLMHKRPKARYVKAVAKMNIADVIAKLISFGEGNLKNQRNAVLFCHGEFDIKESFKLLETRLLKNQAPLVRWQGGRRYAHLHAQGEVEGATRA